MRDPFCPLQTRMKLIFQRNKINAFLRIKLTNRDEVLWSFVFAKTNFLRLTHLLLFAVHTLSCCSEDSIEFRVCFAFVLQNFK